MGIRKPWRDFDNNRSEGTTRHTEFWITECNSAEDVCTKLAKFLGTERDGTVVKVRKGSRVILGLLGVSATPRRFLPVKLTVSTQINSSGHTRVSVTAISGGAALGIDGIVRGDKRFAAAFEFWLSRLREVARPIASEYS